MVRFLVDAEGDPEQHDIASTYIQTHCTVDDPCYLSTVTLCELSWVLARSYRLSRDAIANEIGELLDVQQLQVADRELVRRALADYRQSSADLPDHLIAWLGKAAGAGETATFDKKAGKTPLFEYIGK
ncbi:VapC toxin family PIN domain ribonuclease [Tamilnaduibacter salinus]|uniref:VapC toxin family PIN domain ribonuclease n=1 Tax=Tamilnaduibacter salinus TaxID=1484056 RepID=A0A2A2HZU7_9GAMM|nr:VapC toxin family PIN domain ribonuclease [Tamilnaduibacter salinus]